MNSPKRPIITCASSERLTPSHACQSPETAFFRGPCRPSPLQQQRQQHQNILFPLLRFTRVHQPAGSYRADLCGPINLHVGNILFYMIKMRKDRTKRKNTMHERFTKYKLFRKNWYQFILLRLFSRIWPFSTLVRFAQRIYHDSSSVNVNIYYFKNYLSQKAAYFASRTQP